MHGVQIGGHAGCRRALQDAGCSCRWLRPGRGVRGGRSGGWWADGQGRRAGRTGMAAPGSPASPRGYVPGAGREVELSDGTQRAGSTARHSVVPVGDGRLARPGGPPPASWHGHPLGRPDRDRGRDSSPVSPRWGWQARLGGGGSAEGVCCGFPPDCAPGEQDSRRTHGARGRYSGSSSQLRWAPGGCSERAPAPAPGELPPLKRYQARSGFSLCPGRGTGLARPAGSVWGARA